LLLTDNSMRKFSFLLALLMAETTFGESNLSSCQGNDVSKWTNCKGTASYYKTNTYIGEYIDGKPHGKGELRLTNSDYYVGEFKGGTAHGLGIYTFANGEKHFGEFKNCIFDKPGTSFENWMAGKTQRKFFELLANKFVTPTNPQFIDPKCYKLIDKNNIDIEFAEIKKSESEFTKNLNKQEHISIAEEKARLGEDVRPSQQGNVYRRINLQVTYTQPSSDGALSINVDTNIDTASLKINGEEQGGNPEGKYSILRVARAGQESSFEIVATDIYGYTDKKIITVNRLLVESKIIYPELKPELIKRQPERDAVAVIIGISNYKNFPKADFAKDDAQVFYDYAIRALGVRPGNIKLLMDEQADAEEIYTAFKSWLPARVKSTTDIYVFYSGHGLPTQDGSGLYWLPQRANRDLISKTGILLSEINSDIQASKPKSVTIFMDACYSGQARGGETLVASARPIALKSQPTTFPSNFTVISASQADQISSSSPDLQHGIFSYYLMRGMEGEADLNKDGKITLSETQSYLSDNVGRHARIMNRQQEPQVIGEGSRILVGR
jgi:hypothetical protein